MSVLTASSSRRLTTILVLALVLAAVGASTATAGTNITGSGITGIVQEYSPAVTCRDSGWTNSTTGTVVGPRVYAAQLKNGSRSQYVRYAADLYDFTTRQYYPGTYTSWQPATTTAPAQLPNLAWTMPFMHRIGVRIHILWWDPVSQGYSGTLDYTVDSYWDASYGANGNSATSC